MLFTVQAYGLQAIANLVKLKNANENNKGRTWKDKTEHEKDNIMKRIDINKYLLLWIVIFFSTNAHSEAYIEIDYNKVDMDVVFALDSSIITIKPSIVTAEFGYMFMPYLGIAGTFGKSISDDILFSDAIETVTISGELDSIYSAKIIAQYPFNKTFSVFVNAGISKLNIKFTPTGGGLPEGSLEYNGTGASYGTGLIISFATSHALTFKYEVLPNVDMDNGDKAELTTLGLGYRFWF